MDFIRKYTAMKRLLLLFSLIFVSVVCQGQYAGVVAGSNASTGAYSSERLTDGTFDVGSAWGVTGGWSYDAVNDEMDFDNATNGNLTQADGAMAFPIQINKTYKLEFDISIVGGGNANFTIKSSNGGIEYVAYADYADGPHSFEIGPFGDVGIGGIYFRANEADCDAAFSIDNISLMEVF